MSVLTPLAMNVDLASALKYGVIVCPMVPSWDPQYVIPVTGMLLGDCINSISLCLGLALSALAEGGGGGGGKSGGGVGSRGEADMVLEVGAKAREVASRLRRGAVRTALTPVLNQMAVIGTVSIPGMMTGQILGGSPVLEAARYQMLIMYLITSTCFGSTVMILSSVMKVVFNSDHMMRTD